MMDCRRVKQLLPLWVGQDLPDATSAADVARHLEHCADCERQQKSLQASLECLQGSSSKTLPVEPRRASLWPKLVTRISEWDRSHGRDRYNGWIPASVMALAVALMVVVSIPSILQEFLDDDANRSSMADRFQSDSEFHSYQDSDEARPSQRPAKSIAVDWKPDEKPYRSDQW